MPFGQPIEPPPSRKLECGCVVVGTPDEASRIVLKHCAAHLAELPEDERKRVERERRRGLLDDLYGVSLKVAILGVVAFMVWTVWRGFRGG